MGDFAVPRQTRGRGAVALACLLAAFLAGAAPAQPAATNRLLDGQTFVGKIGAMGKAAHEDDTLIFADGHFISTGCLPYGFARAPYTAEKSGDGIRFRAVVRSPTHGTMTWEGEVRGNEAQAEYRWVRERWFWTQTGHYWYRGTRDATGAAR